VVIHSTSTPADQETICDTLSQVPFLSAISVAIYSMPSEQASSFEEVYAEQPLRISKMLELAHVWTPEAREVVENAVKDVIRRQSSLEKALKFVESVDDRLFFFLMSSLAKRAMGKLVSPEASSPWSSVESTIELLLGGFSCPSSRSLIMTLGRASHECWNLARSYSKGNSAVFGSSDRAAEAVSTLGRAGRGRSVKEKKTKKVAFSAAAAYLAYDVATYAEALVRENPGSSIISGTATLLLACDHEEDREQRLILSCAEEVHAAADLALVSYKNWTNNVD
jgi:hypothetical protein